MCFERPYLRRSTRTGADARLSCLCGNAACPLPAHWSGERDLPAWIDAGQFPAMCQQQGRFNDEGFPLDPLGFCAGRWCEGIWIPSAAPRLKPERTLSVFFTYLSAVEPPSRAGDASELRTQEEHQRVPCSSSAFSTAAPCSCTHKIP